MINPEHITFLSEQNKNFSTGVIVNPEQAASHKNKKEKKSKRGHGEGRRARGGEGRGFSLMYLYFINPSVFI